MGPRFAEKWIEGKPRLGGDRQVDRGGREQGASPAPFSTFPGTRFSNFPSAFLAISCVFPDVAGMERRADGSVSFLGISKTAGMASRISA